MLQQAAIERPSWPPTIADIDGSWTAADVALIYALNGWSVFPANPASKAPLLRAENGRGWKQQASCNPSQVETWWAKHRRAMVGLPTGIGLGAFALDFDPTPERPIEILIGEVERLIDVELPRTWRSATPSGGMHVFFAMPRDLLVGNSRGLLPQGIDVRGEGGYVIAAGSVRADGRMYRWLTSPEETGLAPAPAALLRAIAG